MSCYRPAAGWGNVGVAVLSSAATLGAVLLWSHRDHIIHVAQSLTKKQVGQHSVFSQ